MDCFQVVDPLGIAGGLAVLWKRDLNVSFIRSSNFFIEVGITDADTGFVWRLINLYASTNDGHRRDQWRELVEYRQRDDADWVIWGDFNDLLWDDEKVGGRRREEWSLRAFRNFVADLGAVDLGYSGYPFTWVNRRYGSGLIKERLDRVLVSPGWRVKYDRGFVQHLFSVGSDHAALLLDTNPPRNFGLRSFRFDSRWTSDPESMEVVKKSWQNPVQGSKMFEVFSKVRGCRQELRKWSKAKNFNARRKINEVHQKLIDIGEERRHGWDGEVRELEKELGRLWEQEERFWRQKYRATWMVEGDRNTSFFHAKVAQRRRRNTISGVQDHHGEWKTDETEVANEFVNYFQNLFHSEGIANLSEVVGFIESRITDNMNAALTKNFSVGEIKQALFDIDPTKAPGADGMTAGFYQHYWDVVGEDVVKAVQQFFLTGHILKSLNHTQLVLIPKVKTPVQGDWADLCDPTV
ncbi:hypothetical protein Vadar_017617 [Vaccinium darrowii]|uniref:Uncharacterized protein n=1 Tax=Vaccinium darrowii TaxID=229202 RepID=A0ACB7XAV9_9ERIC|nr:hypothetical protein Vadar_017617 [Vaccinium darrowii]